MIVNHKKLNPNAFYLLKYLNDATLRFIILYGGSSSGKSFSVAQAVLIQTLQDAENTLVMRKVGASISKTIYEDYKVAASLLGISQYFKFIQNSIKNIFLSCPWFSVCPNDCTFNFLSFRIVEFQFVDIAE